RLDIDPPESGAEHLGGDVLGDRRRANAENDLALHHELGDRAEVAEPRGALLRRLAPPVACPQDLALDGRPYERPHLTGKEQPDAGHDEMGTTSTTACPSTSVLLDVSGPGGSSTTKAVVPGKLAFCQFVAPPA